MASIVDSLLSAGKENKGTLESMQKTLSQMLAQDKTQAKEEKLSAAKALQSSKRLAADKVKENNGDSEIIGLLTEIRDSLKDKEGEEGKGGGFNPLAAAAGAATTFGGALLDGAKNIFKPKGTAPKGTAPKGTAPKGTAPKGAPKGALKPGGAAKGGGFLKGAKSVLKGGLTGLASAGIGVGAELLIDKGGEVLDQKITDAKFDEYFKKDEEDRAKLMERWQKRRQKEKDFIESPAFWIDKVTALGGETASESTYKNLDGLIKRIEAAKSDPLNPVNAGGEMPFEAPAGFESPVLKRQSGGPITVPGSGSGDKVPMMLPAGSFVLNRNASNFLRRQEGGSVPTLLEPGEKVFAPGSYGPEIPKLNKTVSRFQEGGEVKSKFEYPLPKGRTGTSARQIFGADRDGGSRKHAGVDLVETAPWGGNPQIPVVAPKDGVVSNERYTRSGYVAGLILNQTDGHDTRYVHMTPEVQPGTEVKSGDRIGKLIDLEDQSHLHFELYKSGDTTAMDPAPYLKSAGKSPGAGRKIPGMETAPDGKKGDETGNTKDTQNKPAIVVLAAGTNDFGTPEPAGNNVKSMVETLKNKNYTTNFISPVDTGKFAAVSASTTKGASQAGANTYMPTAWDSDGYHIAPAEAKNIKNKYPGAIIIGDSNAARIEGTNGTPGKTKVGASTSTIKGFVDALEKGEKTGKSTSSGGGSTNTDSGGGGGGGLGGLLQGLFGGLFGSLSSILGSNASKVLGGLSAGFTSFAGGAAMAAGTQTPGLDLPSLNGEGNNDVSDTGKTSSVGAKISEIELGKNIMNDMGISKQAAAGIVGNLSYESAGLAPNIREGMTYGNSWEEGRTAVPAGYGWAQWSFSRHDKFVKDHLGGFGGENGGSKKVATAEDNYKYLLQEFRGPEPIDDIPQDDEVKAATWFRKVWERAGVPADSKRANIAKNVVQKLQSGGMVQTMLEPGESVFGPGQWDSSIKDMNSAIPRFQSGGQVGKTYNSPNYNTVKSIEQKQMEMDNNNQPIIVPVPLPPQQDSNANDGVTGNSAPPMPSGPSVNFLSDVINRTNMGSVFS